ncbi:MAG: glycosyltransferase family 4 protein [Candidatus Latescibacterota bacterium]
MHIAMVAFTDLRYDYRVYREATALRQAGHRVTVVASAFGPQLPSGWEGVTLRVLPTDRSASLRRTYPAFWGQAARLLTKLRADVYHAHDLDTLWPAVRAARACGAPLVYDSHEFWTEQSSLVRRPAVRAFWRLLEARLVRHAECTITVSDSIAEALRQRYGMHQVAVVRNLPLYRPPEASNRIRTELGLAADFPIVLYQGGFLTDNGLAEQVRAAAGFGRSALVLLGDGPCEGDLRRLVRQLDLAERVHFIRRVSFPQLHSYTCSADLGLCLIKGTGQSFRDSLPNKLFEYLMAGLPVLASDFPEMRRILAQTRAGETAAPDDPSAIAERVCDLLGDAQRRGTYRAAALQAARELNWEAEAPRLLQVYAGL